VGHRSLGTCESTAALEAGRFLARFLPAEIPALRGLAAWAAGPLAAPGHTGAGKTCRRRSLLRDVRPEQLIRRSVAEVARQALALTKTRLHPR